MREWRGAAAALLAAAVLLPAPLLLKRRAAAPADEWRRADFDRALDRALADLDDEPPRRRDDEDVDRALAPRRRLANNTDDEPRRRLADAVECSVVTFAWTEDIKSGGTAYKRVKAADIDGDGDAADLVVVDSTTAIGQYIWWFADDTSAGTLAANQITAYVGQRSGIDLAVGDIDGDQNPDIVVAATGQPVELKWYKNGGDGSSWSTSAGQNIECVSCTVLLAPETVYAADIDGDQDLDVVSATQTNKKVVWYQNTNGAGTFAAAATIAEEWDGTTVTIPEDDGGGYGYGGGGGGGYGYGGGCTAPCREIKAVSVFVADLDDDDKLDVLYADDTNGILGFNVPGDLATSTTDWSVSIAIDDDTTNKAKWVVAADFDGDNDLDVLAAKTDGTIPLYENRLIPDSSVTWTEHASALANGGVTVTSVEVFDIDGDADLDVLAAVSHSDHIRVWRNNGAWSFTSSIAVDDRTDGSGSNGATAYSLVAVDLDADGDLDVVATQPSIPPPTPRPSVSLAPTTLHTCGCPTAFDNVIAEATAIEDANANIVMSANNLGGLGPDSGAEEIRLEGYYRLPDGTVLDMVVRVKDGSTYQSEDTSQNGLYGDGMTALVNVKDDTSVTVTVSLEASVGDFEFENQWYMSLYDFDTQKNQDRQVEEACIDDDQYLLLLQLVLTH